MTTDDREPSYLELFDALTRALAASDDLAGDLAVARAQVAELLPWAVIGARTMADADAEPPFDPDSAWDLLQRSHTFYPSN